MPSRIRLEGIPFKWRGMDPEEGLDCFTYANYLRLQHGKNPFFLNLDKLPTNPYPYPAGTMPRGFLLEAAKAFGIPAIEPLPFHVLIINLGNEDCLSTLLTSGELAFMTLGGSKVRSIKKFPGSSIRGIFRPKGDDEI